MLAASSQLACLVCAILLAQHPAQSDGSIINLVQSTPDLMYPYEHDETDITTTKPHYDQPLPFQIPFFGFRYSRIWVHKDGYIAFNQGMQSYSFPLELPIQPQSDPSKGMDPSMIAPFFAIQSIPTGTSKAGVYMRLVALSQEQNTTLRDRFYDDFRRGMIGASNFRPKFAIIITWRNMTLANETSTKTNTYQAVLATDESRTFVMFNYEQLDSISSSGPFAYVGLNAGNTTRTYEFKPYSQEPRVALLTHRGHGNGLAGRFFFQIDEEITTGACVDVDDDDRWRLSFFPRGGSMLGGTMVNVTGPCLQPSDVIECVFENKSTRGVYRDANHASCIQPLLIYHGYVNLSVRVNNNTRFYGQYYVQPPDTVSHDVTVLDDVDRLEEPQEIMIKWRPEKLSWNANAQARISLWGYREQESVYPSLIYIDTLVDSVPLNQTMLTIILKQFRARDNRDTSDITLGFIQINLTQAEFASSPTIWSRAMPLSWYFKPQWERQHGHEWKTHFCQAWQQQESHSDNFSATVSRCPCNVAQAQLDRGRFLPDSECNIIDRKCDTLHRGALQCFKTGRPSVDGSGQTCCYDDYGELIRTDDTMYAGRPSRASGLGKHPFKTPMIPVLSEYQHDVLPFFFCCKWQPREDDSDTCEMYNQRRTSQDCVDYEPPTLASVFGDPHIITFDSVNYTFNQPGEFTLVHVNNSRHQFELQGRFERLAVRDTNVTELRAIAMAENTSSVVEIRLRPEVARWRYHLYVIVDKEYVSWGDEDMPVQYLKGVTLYQPMGMANMSHIVAMFDSGAGVEVMHNRGHLSVHVYAPHSFLNSTRGLLGNYSNVAWDDFTLPGSEKYLPLQSTEEEIHNAMSKAYRVPEKVTPSDVNQSESIFFHDPIPYSHYDDLGFTPQYDAHLQPDSEHYAEMLEICRDLSNTQLYGCEYDYAITLDAQYAKITRQDELFARSLANEARTKVTRCPSLPKPVNGHKSENRYWPGTIVRFSCKDGYRLVGNDTRRCDDHGHWSEGVDAKCTMISIVNR